MLWADETALERVDELEVCALYTTDLAFEDHLPDCLTCSSLKVTALAG